MRTYRIDFELLGQYPEFETFQTRSAAEKRFAELRPLVKFARMSLVLQHHARRMEIDADSYNDIW